ncbi:MAG: sensor histidine kinase, partial [Sphingomonadaceae bacterium]
LMSALLVVLALLIFAIDTFTPLDMAIAVMYVVVVLLSVNLWRRRGVLLASAACLFLTVLSYGLTHTMVFSGPASGRLVVSLAAISITAWLALRGQAATAALLAREEALRVSRLQLAHVTRVTMLGELAASIAHEVNQPLAAISTNGQACLRWLQRAQPDLEEARSAVTSMLEASARATGVIRRIRSLARRGDPQYSALDLNSVAQDSVDLMRRELHQQHVRLRLALAPALPPVLADRVQLQQVIINLLMNAVQAMAAQPAAEAPLWLELRTLRQPDGALQLAVTDNGPGIAGADLPRLFEPFFSTKTDGMGMGLPICRSIIETHGGRIWAESGSAAAGATLAFTLPVQEPQP